MRILGISGSLRRDSHNRRLLLEAAELLPPGVEFELFEGLKAVPPYDEDDDIEQPHESVVALREAIARADAVLFATPEYNGSVPGQLKNAVDWASRPRGDAALAGKPVAVVGASIGSFGGVWAQADLRRILGVAGARVIEHEFAVPRAHERLVEDDRLVHDEHRGQLTELVEALLAAVSQPAAVAA